MDLDLEELAAIVELLEGADFTEFRLQKGDLSLVVTRGVAPSTPGSTSATPPQEAPVRKQHDPPAAIGPRTVESGPPSTDTALVPDEVLVTTPMLGTFYRSPKPGEPVFVNVGDKIEPETVVGIVEVMKLMTSITAKVAGEVTKVLAVDGDLVEAEQPLFAVRVFG